MALMRVMRLMRLCFWSGSGDIHYCGMLGFQCRRVRSVFPTESLSRVVPGVVTIPQKVGTRSG